MHQTDDGDDDDGDGGDYDEEKDEQDDDLYVKGAVSVPICNNYYNIIIADITHYRRWRTF